MTRYFVTIGLVVVVALAGCGDDSPTSGTGGDMGSVSLSTMALVAASKAEGDLEITRARFVLRDVKLHSKNQSKESEFLSGPFLLELDLSGTLNRITIGAVPAQRYDEVRFVVHKLDDDDERDQQVLENPLFSDFAGSERYSMIIEGRYDAGSGLESFVFRSDDNEEQRSPLIPPLDVDAGGAAVNLTFVMDTRQWFSDGQGGRLDPRDPGNTDAIEENIESSIDIFEDDDEDGREDDSEGDD